jgi:hypothetical protein
MPHDDDRMMQTSIRVPQRIVRQLRALAAMDAQGSERPNASAVVARLIEAEAQRRSEEQSRA